MRVRRVVSQVFRVPIDEVDDDTSPVTVSSWDSIGQLDLVTALEEEFSIKFSPEEIMEMNGVGDIRAVLDRRRIDVR